MENLNNLFKPKSIAVIGAAREEYKVGHIILKNLKENFKGKLYAINPFADEVLGIKCKKSLNEIEEKIDLGVFAVKAEVVVNILKETDNLNSAIVISSGFGEVGNFKLEKELLDIAKKKNIRILGPNCFGYQNPYLGINTTFAKSCGKGKVAIISQSGALGASFIDYAYKNNIGISYFISVGNMLDIRIHEILEFLNKDENTKSILLYIEGLKEGRKFYEVVKKMNKKIYILKAGKSNLGKEVAKTHTGSLAGEYNIYKGVFSQLKIKEIFCLKDLFLLAKVLNKFDKLSKEIIVISNAGGAATIFSDLIEEYKVKLNPLKKEDIEKLNSILPKTWNKKNPIDILGDATPERFEKVIKCLENGKRCFIVVLTPQQMTNPKEVAKRILKFKDKQIFCIFIGGKEVEEGKEILEKGEILCFDWLEECVRILTYF